MAVRKQLTVWTNDRTEDVLLVVESGPPEVRDADGSKGRGGRGAGRELGVHLARELFGRGPVGPYSGAVA